MIATIRPVDCRLSTVGGDTARVAVTYVSAVDGATRTTVVDGRSPCTTRDLRRLVFHALRHIDRAERERQVEAPVA